MSNERLVRWILLLYPLSWRTRYADELAALLDDIGPSASLRVRLDLIVTGLRERAHSIATSHRHPDPGRRARSGISLVLWAWAAFVVAGMLVQKTSEHWQKNTPGGHRGATAAFDALAVTAVVTTILILLAVAVTLPALRGEGWAEIRGRVCMAVGVTVVLVMGTVGLVAWADHLSAAQRDGSDGTYASGFVLWALLGIAAVASWTAVATRAAAIVPLGGAIARLYARLATLVAAGMALMTAATIAWYLLVADRAPAALTGGDGGHSAPAFVGRLVAAMAVMMLAAGASTMGARRAAHAAGALS